MIQKPKLLLMGLSTGGPSHIKKILSSITTLNSHIIIAQHMKHDVIPFFINDMKHEYSLPIIETPTTMQKNPLIVFCSDTCELNSFTLDSITLSRSVKKANYTPDINILFTSMIPLCHTYDVCAIVLTGIGDDGAIGLKALKDNGAYTITESEESTTVFGMPRVADEIGASCQVLSLEQIINHLKKEKFCH